MDGEGLGGITPLRLSFLKQSLTPALDGSPYADKMTVSGTDKQLPFFPQRMMVVKTCS